MAADLMAAVVEESSKAESNFGGIFNGGGRSNGGIFGGSNGEGGGF